MSTESIARIRPLYSSHNVTLFDSTVATSTGGELVAAIESSRHPQRRSANASTPPDTRREPRLSKASALPLTATRPMGNTFTTSFLLSVIAFAAQRPDRAGHTGPNGLMARGAVQVGQGRRGHG